MMHIGTGYRLRNSFDCHNVECSLNSVYWNQKNAHKLSAIIFMLLST